MSFIFSYSSSDIFWCINISGILKWMNSGGVMERGMGTPTLCGIYTLVSSPAECSAWKQFLLLFLLKKIWLMKTQNFQATLIWGMFSCFPRNFTKMLFCDASRRSEHRQRRAWGILSWGRIHCLCPRGMRSAHHLIAPGALVPTLEDILSNVMSQVQSTPSCWCHSGVPLCFGG